MVWTPPVTLPDLGGNDYGRELYAMAAGPGEVLGQQRQDRTKALQFAAQEERLKQQGLMDYGASMAKIAADQDPFGVGGGNMLPGSSAEITYANALNNLDPSDPRWQTALYGLYGTPHASQVQTENGIVTQWAWTPVPPDVAAKAAAAGMVLPGGNSPANPNAAPGTVGAAGPPTGEALTTPPPTVTDPNNPAGSAVIADAGGMRTTTSAPVPGSQQRPTEAIQRDKKLYQGMAPELPTLEKHWDGLSADTTASAATELGVGPFVKSFIASPEYMQSYNALMTIVGNFMWSVSGAQAPPDEVARRVELLLPYPADNASIKKQKLDRVRAMVASVKGSSETGRPPDPSLLDAPLGGGSSGGAVIDVGDGITMERD